MEENLDRKGKTLHQKVPLKDRDRPKRGKLNQDKDAQGRLKIPRVKTDTKERGTKNPVGEFQHNMIDRT